MPPDLDPFSWGKISREPLSFVYCLCNENTSSVYVIFQMYVAFFSV